VTEWRIARWWSSDPSRTCLPVGIRTSSPDADVRSFARGCDRRARRASVRRGLSARRRRPAFEEVVTACRSMPEHELSKLDTGSNALTHSRHLFTEPETATTDRTRRHWMDGGLRNVNPQVVSSSLIPAALPRPGRPPALRSGVAAGGGVGGAERARPLVVAVGTWLVGPSGVVTNRVIPPAQRSQIPGVCDTGRGPGSGVI
jgi:hypothetical protein